MSADWPLEAHHLLSKARVGIVGYVPDAGHKRLIELCQADKAMRAVALTTEEEGIGLAVGAWLGGVTIAAGYGYRSPLVIGAALALAGLAVIAVAFSLDRTPAAHSDAVTS